MKKNFWLICGLMAASAVLAQQTTNVASPTVISTPAPAPVVPSSAALTTPPPAPVATNSTTAKPAKKKAVKKKAPKAGGKKKAGADSTAKKPALKPIASRDALSASTTLSPGPAVVAATHVNVRGQSGLKGEVIGHLSQGDAVTVIEEITLKKSGPDEPSAWAKIAVPAAIHAWVNSGFLDANKAAKSRLNVRGGPGENYSVLGRLETGDTVKELGTKGDWSEIEAPTNCYAYVAAVYLKPTEPEAPSPAVASTTSPTNHLTVPETTSPATSAPPTVASATTPPTLGSGATTPNVASATPPTTVAPLVEIPKPTPITHSPPPAEVITPPVAVTPTARTHEGTSTPAEPPAIKPVVEPTPVPTTVAAKPPLETAPVVPAPVESVAPPVGTPIADAAKPELAPADTIAPERKPGEAPPIRIVQREGIVRGMTSIQAPSKYALISVDTKKNIDYLFTSSTNVDLSRYKGAHVIVVGEEGLDVRWGNTPVIDIHRLIVLKDSGF